MDGGMSAWLPSFLAPVCVSSRRDEGEGEEDWNEEEWDGEESMG